MAFVAKHDGATFATARERDRHVYDTFLTFKDKQGESWIKKPGEVTNMPLKMANLKNCIIKIVDQTEAVIIENCEGCQIFVAACVSSVFVRKSKSCMITAACRQLLIDKSTGIVMSLYCKISSRITYSANLTFTPFETKFPNAFELWTRAKLFPIDRKFFMTWAKIDDYDSDVNNAELPAPHARFLRNANPEELSGIVEGAALFNPRIDRMPDGLAVEARFEGGEEWFPGKISKVNPGATYDVAYDDGDAETRVGSMLIRAYVPPEEEEPAEIPAGASRVWESAVLAFPITAVWNLLSGLDMSKVLPSQVEKCELADADSGWKSVGGVRSMTYRDGAVWQLRLLGLSEIDNSITWEIFAAEPATGFSSRVDTIRLKRVTSGNQTFIEWLSDFSSDAGVDVTEDCRLKKREAFAEIRKVLGAPPLPPPGL